MIEKAEKGMHSNDSDENAEETKSELELGYLNARGRIPTEQIEMWSQDQPRFKHHPNVIDGARLGSYCEESHNINIRLDDSSNLPFWAEINLNLDQLQRWLLVQGVDMKWAPTEEGDSHNVS